MTLSTLLERGWAYLGVSGYVMALCLGLSLLSWLSGGWLAALLGYNVNRVFVHGEVYRFFLSPFLHGSFSHFWGNMLIFAIFGPVMERRLDIEGYWTLFLIGQVSAMVVSSLIEIWYDSYSIGLSGVIYAFQAAYLMMIFTHPTTAWEKVVGYIGLIWILKDIWYSFSAGIRREDNIDHWGHLGGIIGGAFYVKYFFQTANL